MKNQIKKISIPVLMEVGPGKIDEVGKHLERIEMKKLFIYFGEGIKELVGTRIINSILNNKYSEIVEIAECNDNNMEKVVPMAFNVKSNVDVIIGVGGGKIIDIAKYVAFLNNMPFIGIPTSTAHDGFASSGASMMISERRTSVHANMPYGIIVDTALIATSPEKFIYSGIGDIVSKISAVFDWQFEEAQGIAKVDDVAVMIAKKSVNSIARMPFKSIKEPFFIKELVDSLTMSGIAMEMAGNSAPASGSEHLISHALDKMTNLPQLHGIQVGIATYIMSLVQKHRYERVRKFLTDTGFFAHVKTLGLKRADYEAAIDMAPTIKPMRKTYIHFEENRQLAKLLLREDEILKKIFIN